jgi:hypothetical protein
MKKTTRQTVMVTNIHPLTTDQQAAIKGGMVTSAEEKVAKRPKSHDDRFPWGQLKTKEKKPKH